ncbi:MAG TPA: response regulator [Acetobacteraceae bacterium]|nr:response regulator [Acetobacteraceae bacterium]
MAAIARILVVEDEPLVAETIATALAETYLVVTVETAAAAEPHVRERSTDLLLLDCLLPGGQLGELIAHADAAEIPVVLMSGDLQRIEQLQDGKRPFLSKPFTIDALFAVVQRGLGRA